MYAKVHGREGEVLVAVCDKELLGKTFTEDDLVMDVREDFFKGELIKPDSLGGFLGKASILNLVGNGVVNRAVIEGFVDADSVLEICGIKHAQVVEL